jgi:hypothetical protein
MRYLFGFLYVCAVGVLPLPLSASAQADEAAKTSDPSLQEPAPEEPALQLELDAAGVDVVPSPSRTIDAYMLQAIRVRRAKIGIGVSAIAFSVGIAMALGAGVGNIEEPPQSWVAPVGYTGAILAVGGFAGMIASGALLAVRKRKLPSKQELRRLEQRRSEQRRPDDEPPTPTEPSRMRGPTYRPH